MRVRNRQLGRSWVIVSGAATLRSGTFLALAISSVVFTQLGDLEPHVAIIVDAALIHTARPAFVRVPP